MPADTAIQAVALALSDEGGATPTVAEELCETICVVVDITPSYPVLTGKVGI
jgi:hypothetical protein